MNNKSWFERWSSRLVAESERKAFRACEIERELQLAGEMLAELTEPQTNAMGCPMEPTDVQKEQLAVIRKAFEAYQTKLKAELESL